MQEKNTIEQLKSIVTEKEKRVKHLEEELNSLKENVTLYNTTSNQNTQYFLNGNANDNSESEFMRARPPSSSASTNNTFRGRSDSANETLASSSRQSLRSAKPQNQKTNSLNAKVIEQKKEINTDFKLENNELKTLNKASEIERVRLTDLLKTLQKRIEDLNEKLMDSF